MLPQRASAGQKERCMTSQAEQGCEDHPLETPSQEGGNRIKQALSQRATRKQVFSTSGACQNPLEKHFQELPQEEQETNRNLGKPQPSSSRAKSSAVPGAASRPHHQNSQGTQLLVLSFPKERNGSGNPLCWDLARTQLTKSCQPGTSHKGMRSV